ncbi:CinA family nicotinamide mononucleotide deamidase-related protein [Flavobacteriales bacterium]|nr:CinA family nicotinamide mononucleotide deamidase-related protein [Flavobacteriales bacterium]
MKAQIISIGDEILIGQIVNTNAAWIANYLTSEGIECTKITTVSDSKDSIITALKNAVDNSELVIITGGLGPTNDDITKHTLCSFFNDKLERNNDVLFDIKKFFKQKGRSNILDLNKDQALVPSKSKVIRNPLGTAPGIWLSQNNCEVLALPGVPYEMKILVEHFFREFKKNRKLDSIVQKTIFIRNIPESQLAFMLKEWEASINKDIKLAYLPSPGIVRLRLSGVSNSKAKIESLIQCELDKLNSIVKYDDNSKDLNQLVYDLCKIKCISISVAESCTSGLIASSLSQIPGSSNFFLGGIICYSDLSKINLLGINPKLINKKSSVSEDVCFEMAKNVRNKFNSDYSIATTGYAGPSGGTDDNPVGTVLITINSKKGSVTEKILFSGDRKIILNQVRIKALELLIEEIKKYE